MAITDTDKLAIYNGALRRLGSRKLASLSENREPRRVLDDIWGLSSEIVAGALESGEWNFAIRSVEGTYSSTAVPTFGFQRAYRKPDDFRRLASLSGDEYFRTPLVNSEYIDEAAYWFTDLDVLYIRYVSDGSDYGFKSSAWTESFKDYLETKMAWEACERITNSAGKKDRLERDMMMALKKAKSHDSMSEGVKFFPRGSWAKSRSSGASRRDGQR